MMTRAWRIFRIACVPLLLPLGAVYADLAAGLDAVDRKDYSGALVEFQILAEKGDPDAQVNLGNLYMKGWGVKQDYPTAYDWYRKAAAQNSRMAQSKLGVLHYYGLGTVKDSSEAAKCFEKAADQGDPSAQSALGALYAQGEGVSRNLVQAFFWLTLSFEFGDSGASELRAQLAQEMNPGEVAEALARVEEWKREKNIPDPGAVPIGEPLEQSVSKPNPRTPKAKKNSTHRKASHK